MLSISACVIVKNEEKNLPGWLKCVQNLADEYIVVDTGSTDQTKEIAFEGGAIVYDFPWCNDFSAAKNFALEKAKGDWIIFLDADEYFHPQDYKVLKQKIKHYNKNKKVDVLMCKLDNIDVDNHNKSLGITYQSRIFRNRKYIRYHGKVHEYLVNSSGFEKTIQFINEVTIYHTGYSAGIAKKKAERNIKILQNEESVAGNMYNKYTYYVDSYWAIQDYEKVIYYARMHNKSGEKAYGIEGKVYLYLILALKFAGRKWEEIRDTLREAKEKYPKIRWLILLEGIMLYEYKKYILADEVLERIIGKIEKNNVPILTESLNIDYTQTLLPQAYLYRGRLLCMQKKYDKALNSYMMGLKTNRYDVAILTEVLLLLKDVNCIDIIQFLNTIYTKEDSDFLLGVLQRWGIPELMIYYQKNSKTFTINEIDKLLFIQKLDVAAEQMASNLEEKYKLFIWTLSRLGGEFWERSATKMFLPKEWKNVMLSFLNGDFSGLNQMECSIRKDVSDLNINLN